MDGFEQVWSRRLGALDRQGRRRALRPMERLSDGRLRLAGRDVVDFSSNDYLGLSRHPEMISRACAFAERFGAGSGASRLVTGEYPAFAEVERKLAEGKRAEAALVFVSGFQANSSILPALLDPANLSAEPLVFADRLAHASLIAGCLGARTLPIRFRHNDLGHLEELLLRHASASRPAFIVTETVFSMDGDRVDLPALRELARRFGAFLYLDEAHATGVLGENGFGLACGMAGPDCLVMGTFSKALGGFGAYVACTRTLRDYLINRAAGLIYATALPPSVLGTMDAALDLLPGLGPERERVLTHGALFRDALAGAGLDTGVSTTQIVPVILGSEERALAMADGLAARGLLGVAIRPPTVPAGSARLRLSFSARHSSAEVEELGRAVIELARRCR